jgi:hypothetical protein
MIDWPRAQADYPKRPIDMDQRQQEDHDGKRQEEQERQEG